MVFNIIHKNIRWCIICRVGSTAFLFFLIPHALWCYFPVLKVIPHACFLLQPAVVFLPPIGYVIFNSFMFRLWLAGTQDTVLSGSRGACVFIYIYECVSERKILATVFCFDLLYLWNIRLLLLYFSVWWLRDFVVWESVLFLPSEYTLYIFMVLIYSM